MKVLRSLALSSVVLMVAGGAAAAPIVSDNFSDNNLAATGPGEASWFRRSANETIAVADDSAGIGSGPALRLTINTTQTERPIIGTFPATTLGAPVGSQLVLGFDFRFTSAPGNNADGFRFGLYNSNGTVVAADGSANSDNDFGYLASIGTGTGSGVDLFRETSNGSAGELGTGIDRTSVKTATLSNVSIADQLKHSALFTLTRTVAGVDLDVSVDGISRATGSHNTAPFTTFDEIVMSHNAAFGYNIDNVLLDVPEPAATTSLLPLAAAVGLAGRRRQRRR
jgi:hypothetical protein